jgi:prohibitin 2
MMYASNIEEGNKYVSPTYAGKAVGETTTATATATADPPKDQSTKKGYNPMDSWKNRDMSDEAVTKRKRCLYAFIFVVVCTAIGVFAASFGKVESTEFGLEYNIHKKELDDAAKSGGLFIGPPGFEFIKFPSTFITVDLNERTCVSNDGLLVTFSVTFQYQMTESNLKPAIVKYRNYDKWADTVEAAGLSAIHHSCSEFMITEFQSKRGIIQTVMDANLKKKLEGELEQDGVNAVAISLQLKYVGLPLEYLDAVADKQAAEEGIALAIAQRKQATTKANTDLLTAKEESRKIKDTAANEAEVLLTEARLKAEETIYQFQKEAEALVEVKEALNLSSEGVLAYLSNKLLSEVSNLAVTTGEPVKLSQKGSL